MHRAQILAVEDLRALVSELAALDGAPVIDMTVASSSAMNADLARITTFGSRSVLCILSPS